MNFIYFKISQRLWTIVMSALLMLLFLEDRSHAQVGRQIKWLRTGSLHHYSLNWGAEIELGRTGRTQEQMDGLRWPAQYQNQDVLVAKALWIGCTDYQDRNGEFYPYKVITIGPRGHDEFYQFIPVEFKMLGRFEHPAVYVDGLVATDNDLNDVVDEIDPNLICDRMVYNRLITYLGIEVTRKVIQFSQQYHDNYIVYDYVFKNTGVIDLEGNTDAKTLSGVYFYFMYRYGSGLDAFRNNYAASNSINWGKNAVNQTLGIGPRSDAFEFPVQYAWYGPHSAASVDDWGAPNPRSGKLAGIHYVGNMVLHTDTGPQNQENDRTQPRTTMYIGSDSRPQTYGSEMFNPVTMAARYESMAAGHPGITHADAVGDGFADQWTSDGGGISHGQGFGPYTLAPGDSIHLIIAEGVSGMDRDRTIEVGRNWYLWHSNSGQPTLKLPDGSTTDDFNRYKKLWVQTGQDSILKTFRRAAANYQNDFIIPQPPPPPTTLDVKSGGDRIILSWDDNATDYNYFDGYEIYRAIGKADTTYEKIFSCNRSNAVHYFEDRTALRGFDYYYYLISKDDGSQNNVFPTLPLISNKFYTMTNEPAFLRKPAIKSTMDSIRVVPNPFNIRSTSLQFGINAPDRLGFYGLPPECTIKIYTERGDLIETIEHNDGTADELWHSLTSSRQIIVSGVYIAYFEVPRDLYDSQSGDLLYRKGENIIRKFFVIR